MAAGRIVPLVGWASPGVAGLWWLLAYRELKGPALASVGLATRLPATDEREVVEALTELPRGTARDLLADVVRVGLRMSSAVEGPDGTERVEEVGRLLVGASRAARQIAGLDESLTALERRAESDNDVRVIGAADVLERGRDRLVQDMLEALTAMARTQGRLALAEEASRLGGDELFALANALEESVGLRADAEREIEEFLMAGRGPSVT
jgi:hypothetical protein